MKEKRKNLSKKKHSETIESDQQLKELLEQCSPQKREKVIELLSKFKSSTFQFKENLHKKALDLKEKDIELNPDYFTSSYRSDYENNIYVLSNREELQKIITDNTKLQDRYSYPPKLNFDKLIDFINNRIDSINQLDTILKNIQTKEDIRDYTDKVLDSTYHKTTFGIDLKNDNRKGLEHLKEYKSYDEAIEAIDQRNIARNEEKQKILQFVEMRLDIQLKTRALDKEKKAQNFYANVEDEMKTIIKNKDTAIGVMEKLVELEGTLGQEDIVVENGQIKVLSYEQDYKTIDNARESKYTEREKILGQISEKKSNEPRLIKGRWQKELDELIEKREKLTEQIKNIEETRTYIINKGRNIRFPETDNWTISNLIKEQNGQGKPGEAFKNLKEKLEEMANKTIPGSLIKLNEEYKALEKKFEDYKEK
jgi:hypothetical protein